MGTGRDSREVRREKGEGKGEGKRVSDRWMIKGGRGRGGHQTHALILCPTSHLLSRNTTSKEDLPLPSKMGPKAKAKAGETGGGGGGKGKGKQKAVETPGGGSKVSKTDEVTRAEGRGSRRELTRSVPERGGGIVLSCRDRS